MGVGPGHAGARLEGLAIGEPAGQASDRKYCGQVWAHNQNWGPWLSVCTPVASGSPMGMCVALETGDRSWARSCRCTACGGVGCGGSPKAILL